MVAAALPVTDEQRMELGRMAGSSVFATPLSDPADTADPLVGEPIPPPPHRVRVHPPPAGDLLVRHPISRPQQRLSLHHLTVRKSWVPSDTVQRVVELTLLASL